jgi:hypothetical protein
MRSSIATERGSALLLGNNPSEHPTTGGYSSLKGSKVLQFEGLNPGALRVVVLPT